MDIVKLFIDSGINVSACNNLQETALDLAIKFNNQEIIDILKNNQ